MQHPDLTVITHVYNAQAAVDHHLGLWKQLPREVSARIEFIVVDDCSDTPLDIDPGHLDVRLFRVIDDIAWNMPGCKNLAAVQARSDWLLFFDVDNVIEPDGFARLIAGLPQLDASTLYRFRRIHDGREVDSHINTLLMSRRGFLRAGMIDEDFAGHYGYEDVHFHMVWHHRIGSSVLLTNVMFHQQSTRTSGLDRDTSRNQALGTAKIYERDYENSPGKLRFRWEERDLPRAG